MLPRALSAALFLALFTFQISLAGASLACAMDDHATGAARGPMAGASIVGMDTGMDMDGAPPAQDQPCDHPVSPRDCQSMAPCGISFLLAEGTAEPEIGAALFAAIQANVTAPASISFRPEPPPPRA